MSESGIDELLAAYERARPALESADEEFQGLTGPLLKNVPGKGFDKRLRSWLPGDELEELEDEARTGFVTLATFYVTDTLVFERSVSGKTAIDRFIKRRKGQVSPLVQALGGARLYAGPVRLAMDKGVILEDILSETEIAIHTGTMTPTRAGDVVAARAVTWPADGGTALALAPLVPLDEVGRELLEPLFAQEAIPGPGQSQRVLQRLYRHFIRHGLIRLINGEGMTVYRDESLVSGAEPTHTPPPRIMPVLSLNETDPTDRLIQNWMDAAPSSAQIGLARLLATPDALLRALIHAVSARENGQPDKETVALKVTKLLAETLEARERAGLLGRAASRSQIRGQIRESLPNRVQHEAVTAAYDTLMDEIQIEAGGWRQVEDPQMARVIDRIRALQARTTEQGFSEEEAYAAARKLAELMDRYGAELSEVQLAQHSMRAEHIETGQRRSTPLHDCAGAIAHFCDCRIWIEIAEDKTRSIVFFGLQQDTQAAVALFDLVARTLEDELAAYKRSDDYLRGNTGDRRRASHAFSVGLIARIGDRLEEMKAERQAAGIRSSGRDLVVLKSAEIERELERLGLNLVSRSSRRSMQDEDAYFAGRSAGEKFEV